MLLGGWPHVGPRNQLLDRVGPTTDTARRASTVTSCYGDTLLNSLRIGPLRFQTCGHKRRPNLALFFVFILCEMHVCFWCVRFSFLVISQEMGWKERLQNNPFCVEWDVKQTKTLAQTTETACWLFEYSLVLSCWNVVIRRWRCGTLSWLFTSTQNIAWDLHYFHAFRHQTMYWRCVFRRSCSSIRLSG